MDSTGDKPITTRRATWQLLGAALDFLAKLMPLVLIAFGVAAFVRGQYESMHELFVIALLVAISEQQGMVHKAVTRLSTAQIEHERRAARENLATLDLLRRTLERR